MTYAKAFPAASRALCGRTGATLVDAFLRTQRHRRGPVVAWLFAGPEHLNDTEFLAQIKQLDPRIGLVVRDYHESGAARLYALARSQRRACLTSPSSVTGFGRHVPQWQRPVKDAVSMSVHSAAQAIRARRSKARIVFISPLYPTRSHPGAKHLGLWQARHLAKLSDACVFALGGLTPETAKCLGPRFKGVAGIRAVLQAD